MIRFLAVNIWLALMAAPAYAQCLAVSPDKVQVAYAGVENPLSVAVAGRDCRDIKVVASDGELVRVDDCHYIFRTRKPGKTHLCLIGNIKGQNDTLSVQEFRVKEIPPPTARLAGKTGGSIARSVLLAQIGVIAQLENFDFDVRFVIPSLHVSGVRGEQSIFEHYNESNIFSGLVKESFKKLQPGDKLFISEIKCHMPSGNIVILEDINLTIN